MVIALCNNVILVMLKPTPFAGMATLNACEQIKSRLQPQPQSGFNAGGMRFSAIFEAKAVWLGILVEESRTRRCVVRSLSHGLDLQKFQHFRLRFFCGRNTSENRLRWISSSINSYP